MRVLQNIQGNRYGRLVVVQRSSRQHKNSVNYQYWRCKCDCGNETDVYHYHLVNDITHSCGCIRREVTRRRSTTHGLYNTKLHSVWKGILDRCRNPKCHAYKDYGGRGITLCEEWQNSFQSFYDWAMQNGYSQNLEIDRIDFNGNYEPSNCRWANAIEQANNKRNNHWETYNGKTQTLAMWSREYGLRRDILYRRINGMGLTIEEALALPIYTGNHIGTRAIRKLKK